MSCTQLPYDYAQDAQANVWTFAVEVQTLRQEGLSDNDLRWLVSKGLALHAHEIKEFGDDERHFRNLGRLKFTRESCFVLTAAGVELARRIMPKIEDDPRPDPPAPRADNGAGNGQIGSRGDDAAQSNGKPVWDEEVRLLCWHGTVIKQFRTPAPNQEAILTAFEEEDWPEHIDDSIVPRPNQDPKRRLQMTIYSLNRGLQRPLLVFRGDGCACGIRWERLSPLTNDL